MRGQEAVGAGTGGGWRTGGGCRDKGAKRGPPAPRRARRAGARPRSVPLCRAGRPQEGKRGPEACRRLGSPRSRSSPRVGRFRQQPPAVLWENPVPVGEPLPRCNSSSAGSAAHGTRLPRTRRSAPRPRSARPAPRPPARQAPGGKPPPPRRYNGPPSSPPIVGPVPSSPPAGTQSQASSQSRPARGCLRRLGAGPSRMRVKVALGAGAGEGAGLPLGPGAPRGPGAPPPPPRGLGGDRALRSAAGGRWWRGGRAMGPLRQQVSARAGPARSGVPRSAGASPSGPGAAPALPKGPGPVSAGCAARSAPLPPAGVPSRARCRPAAALPRRLPPREAASPAPAVPRAAGASRGLRGEELRRRAGAAARCPAARGEPGSEELGRRVPLTGDRPGGTAARWGGALSAPARC